MIDQNSIDQALAKKVNYSIDPPRLGNQYEEDVALKQYLQIYVQDQEVIDDLKRFGEKVASRKYLDMMQDAERQKPEHVQFDAYGARVDKLVLSDGWKYFKDEAAREGLTSLAYTSKNPNARLHQIAKIYLFSASSGLVSCPLAMTDGATFILRDLKRQKSPYFTAELENAYEHLLSVEPESFWTSGQWMTEKRGGSDVSAGTDTFAVEKDGKALLYGYKWFSSATDSEMSLATVRFPKNKEELESNKGKIALVFVKIRDDQGQLNNIEVVRLKDKLGTKQLPTAELILRGSVGTRISDVGVGIKSISSMLNVTRIHNACSSVSGMRRIIALAADYAQRRVAFGKKIGEHGLHVQTLEKLEMTYRGNLLLVLESAYLLQQIDK